MECIIDLLGSNKQIAIPFTEMTQFIFQKKGIIILEQSQGINVSKIMFLSSYVSFFVSFWKYKSKNKPLFKVH